MPRRRAAVGVLFGDGAAPSAAEAEGGAEALVQGCLALVALLHCCAAKAGPSLAAALEAVAAGATGAVKQMVQVGGVFWGGWGVLGSAPCVAAAGASDVASGGRRGSG
eukprot:91111-Chlamydomonas_euryale.AAC.1